MQRRRGFVGIFIFFLFIAIFLFFAFRTSFLNSIYGVVQLAILPLQRSVHLALWNVTVKNTSEKELQEENQRLRTQMVTFQEMKKENSALHDQYEASELSIYKQIPATVVGTKGFVPGISLPAQLIIDKGSTDAIVVGTVIISKNNVVGRVVRVTPHLSLVDPVTKQGLTFTGKELQTGALGVIKGQGDGIIFDNVVLSDTLHLGDMVVTKGDLNEKGIGAPPGLVIGKITSLDRRPSNLFQSAEVQSLVDLTQLTTVFVVKIK